MVLLYHSLIVMVGELVRISAQARENLRYLKICLFVITALFYRGWAKSRQILGCIFNSVFTRWNTSVKSRLIDRLVFFTAEWFKMFLFTYLMIFLGSVYCTKGSAYVVFATLGKKLTKKDKFL